MKAVVGLGNPGIRYKRTRHNAGFMLMDELILRYGLKLKAGKGEYLIAVSETLDTAFAKPLTYMNHSGVAVKDILSRYHVSEEDLLVLYDDLDLALGRIKIKANGSAGTHNGMRSVIQQLNSDAFPRLKIGIDVDGRRDEGSSVDYVLSGFSRGERAQLDEVLPLAADAVDCYIRNGLEQAMNLYNQRQ